MERLWQRLGLLVLPLVLVAAFGPAIAQGLVLAPGDGLAFYYPIRVVAAEAARLGEAPFWNPYAFAGTPLLAGLQVGCFYPGNMAFAWLPPAIAMNVTVLAAYAVAGLATYGFARSVALSRLGASVAAIAFMLSGFMVAHLEHVTLIQGAAWLPVLLWAVERYRERRSARYALLGALSLAAQVLAGHPTAVVFSLLVVGPYMAWRSRGLTGRDRLGYMAGLGAALALGVGLALAQLVPTFALIAESQRQGFTYAQLVAEALPPRQVLTLWMPFLFGTPPSGWFAIPYWGAGPWFDEVTGYAGVATLALAGAAIAAPRRPGAVWFWAAVAVAALVLATGGATPLYKLWAQLPVLKSLRAPGRHLFELDFALAMLAGYGATALARSLVSRRRALAAWGLVGLPIVGTAIALGLAGARLAAKLQPFMPADVDLGHALSPTNPAVWVPAIVWVATGVVIAGLARSRHAGWRLALLALVAADMVLFTHFQGWRQLSPGAAMVSSPRVWPPSTDRSLTVTRSPYPYYDVAAVAALEPPGFALLHGERAVDGYDAFIQRRYSALMGHMSSGGTLEDTAIWRSGHHGLDVLGTRWLRLESSLATTPEWEARLTPSRWRRQPGAGAMARFENARALPSAWRPTAVTLLSAERVDARMTDDATFDPSHEALLEEPVATAGWTPGTAMLERPGMGRIEVVTEGPGPGMLVVGEAFHPGWRAFVGDRELPVHRVDGLVVGVEVPAGRQRVALRYTPPGWHLGLAGSGLALVLMGLWAGWARRQAGSMKSKRFK